MATKTEPEKAKLTPLVALSAAKAAKEEREAALEESKRMFSDADEAHARARARAREHHRDANRALIKSVRAAKSAGINMTSVCDAIGLTYQMVNRIERQVQEWDAERDASANGNESG